MTVLTHVHVRSLRRGFSLIEVLLAVFILGIGVISIAALFPAGIAQQRLAADDVMGPIVANSAISIIRTKVRQDDFGTFEAFHDGWYPTRPTVDGDWTWMRPGVLLADDPSTEFNEAGALDIFNFYRTRQEFGQTIPFRSASEWPDGWPPPVSGIRPEIYGIPFNPTVYGFNSPTSGAPRFLISQEERYYPMEQSWTRRTELPTPQYAWDCMFRRYQGRVYVAIFVYRVSSPGGERVAYRVPTHPNDWTQPLLPMMLDLLDDSGPYSAGVWDVQYDSVTNLPAPFAYGTDDPYDRYDIRQSWQEQRQWLLDQNNNVHRVINREHPDDLSSVEWPHEFHRIELGRPLMPVTLAWNPNNTTLNEVFPTDSPHWYYADPNDTPGNNDFINQFQFDLGVVTNIWYIPRHIQDDNGNELTLTPVYVTVKEL